MTIPTTQPPTMTAAQAARWHAVVFQRHAVRTYVPMPLEGEQGVTLADLTPERLGPARARHVLVEGQEAADSVFRGVMGNFGKVLGAPALLLFIGQTEDPGFMAGVGYLGEQLVLEATALGLATCWVGGYFRRDLAREYVAMAPGEEVICVSPVGHPEETRGLRRVHDTAVRLFSAGWGRRKSLAEITRGEIKTLWLLDALEAARWAPSSHNGQPWRFILRGGSVAVTHDLPARPLAPWSEDPRTLDCGIAMANFAVAARARGKAGRWVQVPGASPAKWWWEELS